MQSINVILKNSTTNHIDQLAINSIHLLHGKCSLNRWDNFFLYEPMFNIVPIDIHLSRTG